MMPVSNPADRRQLAVLGYHKIGVPPSGGWETWFLISRETFRLQLRALIEAGWTVVDMNAIVDALDSPDVLPAKAALITFDDGYRSVREVALPIVQDLGVPTTVFVPTDYIGGDNVFDAGSEPREPLCDWKDLHALAEAGVSIQSHTASHARLSDLDVPDAERELAESKDILERELGIQVEAIAYPYGDAGRDPEITRALLGQIGYKAAFLYGGGLNDLPASDRYGLMRLAMGPDTELAALLANGGA
jgi:peptidoglycan/xylan/chitin deacetylase (PgdA/CDA1 family)